MEKLLTRVDGNQPDEEKQLRDLKFAYGTSHKGLETSQRTKNDAKYSTRLKKLKFIPSKLRKAVCLYVCTSVLTVGKQKIVKGNKLLARATDKIILKKTNYNSKECIEASGKDLMQLTDLNQKT